MDVSSKYFLLLKRPSLYWGLHFWRFMVDIYRVGKWRELISFTIWEIAHQTGFYQIRRRYIKFNENEYLSLLTNTSDITNQEFFTNWLLKQELYLQSIVIDWKYCLFTKDGLVWGCRYSNVNTLYCSKDESQTVQLVHVFDHPITSMFISKKNIIFVCSNGIVYRSDNQGSSFKKVLQLSSSISYFLFNNGMTELPDERLLIGEYGSIWKGNSWQNLAFLYHSDNQGETWTASDFLMQQGVNKHIHIVKYCERLNGVLLTDGDNKKQVWINIALSDFNTKANSRKAGWYLINKFHYQMGGYLSMAESKETILLGSDYLGGTNFVVKTADCKTFEKLVLPDPYRRSPIANMVVRQTSAGQEIWATTYSCLSGKAKSLVMYTQNSGETWIRVIEFDGTKNEVRLVSSSQDITNKLYLSITQFGSQPNQHQHQVYKLE